MYMECSKKHPAETSGKYNTVNVEIFEQIKFHLVSSSSTNVNFRPYKISTKGVVSNTK